MRRKANALSAGPCLSVNLTRPLFSALTRAATQNATTLSGYTRAAVIAALRRDGVMEVQPGKRSTEPVQAMP